MAPALETCSLQTVMDTLDRSVMMDGGRSRPAQSAGKNLVDRWEGGKIHYIVNNLLRGWGGGI